MLRKLTVMFAFVFLAFGLIAPSAGAAVTFDPATGSGFVGKGDVQLAFGWNNKQLQTNADSVSFSYSSTTVAETTWTCDRDAGPQTQERNNTTTTTTAGVVDGVARDGKNQVTGFNLVGYDGNATESSTSEGNQIGSCPTNWTAINLVEGEPVVTGGGLFANYNGTIVQIQ